MSRYSNDRRGRGSLGSMNRRFGNRYEKKSDMKVELKRPDWEHMTLSHFEKNFYTEHPMVTARSEDEISDYLNANEIVIEHCSLRPIFHFTEANFPSYIMSTLANMRFDKPTPIQACSWPILLSGMDLVGIAQTGSGKTLAYMLPAVVQASNQEFTNAGDGPIILILAPTRELAQQIQSVASEFGRTTQCRNCCVYGGASKRAQITEYRRGAEIVIATPGRLIDFLSTGEMTLNRVTYLVLDEADRMLDMGFEPQIRRIIEQIRPDRQTCMFSATWPADVRRLAEDFLTHAAYITIGDRELSANHNITQIIEICGERDKEFKIKTVLREIMKERDSKTIVFAQTKNRVKAFHRILSGMGFPVLAIHGDKKQPERDRTLKDFREMRRVILIATDVASRGLDVEDVKFVVNIDYPAQTEDYIHRIGRTARSNHHGTSYTFFTDRNSREAPKLIKVLREANQPVPDKLQEMIGLHGRGYMSKPGRKFPGRADRMPLARNMDVDRKRSRFDEVDVFDRTKKPFNANLRAPASATPPGPLNSMQGGFGYGTNHGNFGSFGTGNSLYNNKGPTDASSYAPWPPAGGNMSWSGTRTNDNWGGLANYPPNTQWNSQSSWNAHSGNRGQNFY